MIARRLLQRGEGWLLNVPLFKTVYAPVKQLVAAFSPDSESGFKKVVIVDDARRGTVIGFLTREFTIDRVALAMVGFWEISVGVRTEEPDVARTCTVPSPEPLVDEVVFRFCVDG